MRREGIERKKKKKKRKEEEKREREGNACEICFQKVIPPILSASNPNLVSGVKSCQSSIGRQAAVFNEKSMAVFIFNIFIFCKRIWSSL